MLESHSLAKPLSTTRAAVSNGSRLHAKGIDRRTRDARRFRDLVASFTASLGGEAALNEADEALVRNAAALAAKAERMQAAIVKGEDVDLEDLTRLSNCVSRVLGQLGVKQNRRAAPPSLDEYLAAYHDGDLCEPKRCQIPAQGRDDDAPRAQRSRAARPRA